jgi:hypothetical protein
MDQEIHVPANAIIGAFITAAVGALGWIIKVAAKQTLEGFQQSLLQHTVALKELTATVEEHRREMADLRVVHADLNARLRVLESK